MTTRPENGRYIYANNMPVGDYHTGWIYDLEFGEDTGNEVVIRWPMFLLYENPVSFWMTWRRAPEKVENDSVNHPAHYTQHPSGVECIQITEHMSFTLGNAVKYIWRADLKNGVEDLKKAAWYIQREIDKRERS